MGCDTGQLHVQSRQVIGLALVAASCFKIIKKCGHTVRIQQKVPQGDKK
jgi:hypothetical protein